MVEKKKPLTPEMEAYKDADHMEKHYKGMKEALRETVLDQLKTSKQKKFDGLNHRVQVTHPINEQKVYDWVKENWPELVDSLRVDKIDQEKLKKAYALGQIDYNEVPPECYEEKVVDVITIPKKKDDFREVIREATDERF